DGSTAAGRAYPLLSHPKKRAEYAEARRLLASGAFGGGGFGGFPGGGGGFPRGTRGGGEGPGGRRGRVGNPLGGGGAGGFPAGTRVRGEALGGLGDLFGNLFGGGRASQTAARRGRDVESEVTLGFEEAVRGATIPLQLRGRAPCHTCHGSGAKRGTLPRPCRTCNGRGTVTRDRRLFGLPSPCPTCQGRGSVIDDPCPTCDGRGSEVRTRELRGRVPGGGHHRPPLQPHQPARA